MRIYLKLKEQAGATLVEVLVAIALTGIMLPALATALVSSHAGKASSIQQLQATSLMHEAIDATRNVREKGWTNIATDGTYHPVISGSTWALVNGSESISGFTRQVVISSVQRNASNVIVSSGGTTDPSTKHVVVTVSWTTPTVGSVSNDAYFTRWQNNTTWVQTTQGDFTAGTLTNTCAVSTCAAATQPNNSVQLQDSPATWQLPSVIGSYNVTGSVSGLTVFEATIGTTPYAFVGYSGGLAIVNVSNPASPTLVSSYTAQGQVNGIYVVGTTAYLATSSDTAELVTLNVANPATPAMQDTLNLGDAGDANTVFVTGGFAYVGKVAAGLLNQEFFIVNVSNPANITQTGTLARLNADINSIYVSGNFAYLATSQSNSQLRVVNVTTKNSPSNAATVNLGVTANKVDVSSGTYAYVATQSNGTAGEVRVYNVSTPTAPSAVGSGYEVGGNVIGLDIDPANPNYLILATAVASKQAIILNISTPASISLVNNMNIGSSLNKVMIAGSYAYFGSTNTSQELTIVYTGYRPSGTFESSTFDATANVGFNYFTFTNTVPGDSTLKYQIAANNTGSTWSYIGPDGTASSYFTSPGSIPLSVTSNRYFRYKAFFTPTTNGQQTPVISDVTVNYSP